MPKGNGFSAAAVIKAAQNFPKGKLFTDVSNGKSTRMTTKMESFAYLTVEDLNPFPFLDLFLKQAKPDVIAVKYTKDRYVFTAYRLK